MTKKIKQNKMNLAHNIKKILFLISGFFLFLFFLFLKGQYRGPHIFYRIAQKADSFLGLIAKEFITTKTLGQLFTNWSIYTSEYHNSRCSKIAIIKYSTSDLSGYGSKEFKKGGETIPEQQRGLIINFMDDFLINKKKLNIIDLGCGNGDVVAYMANKYQHHTFSGIDFNVENARSSHSSLTFFDGYALDEIEKICPDVIFSSSTWVCFTPKEVESYLEKFNQINTKDIFISEPFWGPKYIHNDTKVESFHLEEAVWLHNWPSYFKKFGYELINKEIFNYKHPKSERIDIRIFNGHWRLKT